MTDSQTPRRKRGEGSAPVWVPSRSAFRVRLPRAPGQRWQQDIFVKGSGPNDSVAEKAAWAELRKGLHARDVGSARRLDRRTTVGVWTTRWVVDAANLRRESRRTYGAIARIIDRELGRIRLIDLQPSDVAAMLTRLEAAGFTANRRYAILSVLRLAIDAAVDDEKVGRNVARVIDPPRRTKAMIRPPTSDDVDAILGRVDGDPVFAGIYAVTATAGLREGEVLGLRWRDLVGSTLIVDGQLGYRLDETVAPKSEASRRVIPLPAWVVAVLAERRRWQLADGSAGSDGLMFTTPASFAGHSHRPIGSPMRAHTLIDHLHRVCDELGLRPYRWHDFRHAAATRLLAKGVDIEVVRQVMGHATIATTAQYLHTEGGAGLVDALDPRARQTS